MPFNIIREDITRVKADAIVISANPHVQYGGWTDTAVYNAAGAEKMLEAREKIGDIARGTAAYTSAFDLPSKYIIHTVGPRWRGGLQGEPLILRSCYRESFALAAELGCKSVAFPLISAGIYEYPKNEALKIATEESRIFLEGHDEMELILVVFEEDAFKLSGNLVDKVSSYIDDAYAEEKMWNTDLITVFSDRHSRPWKSEDIFVPSDIKDDAAVQTGPDNQPDQPKAPPKPHRNITINFSDFKYLLKQDSDTFVQRLISLMGDKKMTAPDLYRRANLTKQNFSKIISEKSKPKKNTVMALAIGLRLNMEEATDLLQLAGYALSPGEPTDMIFGYFITHQMYDIDKLNILLFDMNLKTLCG